MLSIDDLSDNSRKILFISKENKAIWELDKIKKKMKLNILMMMMMKLKKKIMKMKKIKIQKVMLKMKNINNFNSLF